jgi:hypothetical protein
MMNMNVNSKNAKPFVGTTFQRATTTTTTTSITNHQQNIFANANRGLYNNPNPWNSGTGGGLQFSSKAQMIMTMLSMMNSLVSGDFGQMMNLLNGMNGQQMPQGYGPVQTTGGRPGQLPSEVPTFGTRVRGAQGPGATIPGTAPGQVKEMKVGQTAKGANGSVVKWGQDGTVTVDYQDKNGHNKHISVKDGMMSLDGGQPRKLENTGQLIEIPNGDVVGLGNNPGPRGKDLVRVVVADDVKKVRTEPASATNIYKVGHLEQKRTSLEGGGISLDVKMGSYGTPFGGASYLQASLSAFAGFPVTRSSFLPMMSLVGSK